MLRHGYVSFTEHMFFHCSQSPRARVKTLKHVDTDPREAKERTLHVFEVEYQAFIHMKKHGVYSRDLRHKNLFLTSVSKKTIYFWRKSLTWSNLLETASYSAISGLPF